MHEGSITIRLAAKVSEIERMSRLVRKFGELHEIPSRTLYSVTLALDELVSNAVLYGFENADESEIVVEIATEGDNLVAKVTDTGREFNPLTVPLPDLTAPLETRQIGGLGIHLVRSLMDAVAYRREPGKNVLTVKKKFR